MSFKEKFQQGREIIVPSMMQNVEGKRPKPTKFAPVRVKIGGKYFVSKEGISVFENRARASRAILGAMKKAVVGTMQNSEGGYDKVRGADGIIKILFKDVYVSAQETKQLKSQFVAYLLRSITFEPSTLEEFLLNQFGVFI